MQCLQVVIVIIVNWIHMEWEYNNKDVILFKE
jgi:hypothetical protein